VIFHKPGHFTNSLRRFPYKVDSGWVTEKNRKGLDPGMFSEEELEKTSTLAVNLQKWLAAAIAYYDASPKPVVEKKYEKVESKTKVGTGMKKKLGSSTESSPKITIKTVGAADPGSRVKQNGAHKTSSREPLNSNGFKRAEIDVGGEEVKYAVGTTERSNLRPTLGDARSPAGSGPKYNSRPLSAKTAPKPPTVKTIPMSPSVGSAKRSAALSTNPKVINMRVDEHRALIEQTKREVRDLRSMEAKHRWDMTRAEKKDVEDQEAYEENELRQWRWKENDDMKALIQRVNEEKQVSALCDSREFQDHKRERRRIEKEQEIKLIEDAYLEHKKDSRWDADLKKSIAMERAEIVLNNIDQYNHIRETSKALDVQYKQEQMESRMLEQRNEASLLQKKLLAEKESLLQSLKFVHDRSSAPLNSRR